MGLQTQPSIFLLLLRGRRLFTLGTLTRWLLNRFRVVELGGPSKASPFWHNEGCYASDMQTGMPQKKGSLCQITLPGPTLWWGSKKWSIQNPSGLIVLIMMMAIVPLLITTIIQLAELATCACHCLKSSIKVTPSIHPTVPWCGHNHGLHFRDGWLWEAKQILWGHSNSAWWNSYLYQTNSDLKTESWKKILSSCVLFP